MSSRVERELLIHAIGKVVLAAGRIEMDMYTWKFLKKILGKLSQADLKGLEKLTHGIRPEHFYRVTWGYKDGQSFSVTVAALDEKHAEELSHYDLFIMARPFDLSDLGASITTVRL